MRRGRSRRTRAGLDADAIAEHVKTTGGVAGVAGAQAVSLEVFFATQADVFIRAALENQVTEETARLLQVRLVAEGGQRPDDDRRRRGGRVTPM
jgi:glutamate dehydrogenase/leucine dehydrogenase